MCAALSAAGAAGASAVGEELVTPEQQEILTRDYAFLKRVVGEYTPKWVTALTTLDERSVQEVIHIDSSADKPLLKLMADRFVKAKTDEVFSEAALLSEGMFSSLSPLLDRLQDSFTTKQKVAFLTERFKAHSALGQRYVQDTVRLATEMQAFQARNKDLQMPVEMRSRGEALRDNSTQNTMVIDKLRTAMEKIGEADSDESFVDDMANARLNFTIVENVEMSYEQLITKLEQLVLFLTKPGFEKAVQKECDAKVWQAATALAIERGVDAFKGQKYDCPMLNFMYHKHAAADNEGALFADAEVLVTALAK